MAFVIAVFDAMNALTILGKNARGSITLSDGQLSKRAAKK
jgi:hypothetical protein